MFVTNVSCENQLDITQVGGKVKNVFSVQGINRSAFYIVAEILLYWHFNRADVMSLFDKYLNNSSSSKKVKIKMLKVLINIKICSVDIV